MAQDDQEVRQARGPRTSGPDDASDLERLVSGAPIHARDRVPDVVFRIQGRLLDSLS